MKGMRKSIPPQHGLCYDVGDVVAGCEMSGVDKAADACNESANFVL